MLLKFNANISFLFIVVSALSGAWRAHHILCKLQVARFQQVPQRNNLKTVNCRKISWLNHVTVICNTFLVIIIPMMQCRFVCSLDSNWYWGQWKSLSSFPFSVLLQQKSIFNHLLLLFSSSSGSRDKWFLWKNNEMIPKFHHLKYFLIVSLD